MASSSNKPEYLDACFDQFVEETIADWKVLGASLAVVEGDDIYAKGYGCNRPGGRQTTQDTLYPVASMSKSFTASAVAILVDDNERYPQVQWDTPVSQLLREDFVLSDPYRTQNVTIEDILCHRTGMYSHEDVGFGWDAKHPSTAKSITRCLRHLPLENPFRTSYQYSNLMFNVASHLVETVTGRAFDETLRESFWRPLGMDRTYLDSYLTSDVEKDRSVRDGNMAQGCYWDREKEYYVELPDLYTPEGQGASGIVSSANDWALWIRGMIQKTTIISPESMAELTRPRIIATGYSRPFQSPLFYGLGWKIEYYRGYKIVSHAGGLYGFTCYMMWLPERKWGAVMFGNTESVWNAISVVIWTLLDRVLGVPLSERTNWTQLKRDEAEVIKQKQANRKADVFPDRAEPSLPMPLPLRAYSGQYKHPAYLELHIEIKDGELFADCADPTFSYRLRFKHASGNYFVAERQDFPQHASDNPVHRLKSAFEVSHKGKVERIGIDLTNRAGSEWIWFKRID